MKKYVDCVIYLMLFSMTILYLGIKVEVERLENQIKTNAAILQDTKTISNNWKMMAYQAVEIAEKQKVEIETLRK